jgi:hypothetical protein
MADKTSVLKGGKDLLTKTRTVARTMTTATVIATLPKGSRFVGIILMGTASDAGTTATLSFGTTSTSNELVNALDVKTAATGSGIGLLRGVTGVGVTVAPPFTADQPIYAKYAETGGASTAGAWVAVILYTTGNITNDDTL